MEKIRADKKYFPISVEQIERDLNAVGHLDCFADYECDDEGSAIGTRLRLNISAPTEMRSSWKMALKLHNTRIDGIDYHEWLPMPNG